MQGLVLIILLIFLLYYFLFFWKCKHRWVGLLIIINMIQQRQQKEPPTLFQKNLDDGFPTASKLLDLDNIPAIRILKTQNLMSLLSNSAPHARTEKECKAIAELLKSEPYFEMIARNQKVLQQVSGWIQYCKIKENDYVYHIGDPADCYFILLKGEIMMSAPEKIVVEEVEKEIQVKLGPPLKRLPFQSPITPLSTPHLSKVQLSLNENQLNEAKKLSRKMSMMAPELMATPATPATPVKQKIEVSQRMIRVINPGESFGDLGELLKRGSNAVAKENSHLLIVRRQHYSQIANAQLKSESKIKYEFLSCVPLFGLLYRYSLESIIYFLQECKVGYNNIIYNEDDLLKYVYIIYKGEFKLYKKINSKKQSNSSRDSQPEIKQIRILQRNISFKTIGLGEVLAYIETFHKQEKYVQTCVCKSQEGVVLRIEKNKFMKKILSLDNNLEEINIFMKERREVKIQEMQMFCLKQTNDQMYVRYLHTPSARSRRLKTQSACERQRQDRKDQLRRLSVSNNNFFSEFNKTVDHHTRSKRISLNRSMRIGSEPEDVPSGIKDIVEMVKHETNYQSLRKREKNVTLFEFNISKVPLHVKKKYDFLFKK